MSIARALEVVQDYQLKSKNPRKDRYVQKLAQLLHEIQQLPLNTAQQNALDFHLRILIHQFALNGNHVRPKKEFQSLIYFLRSELSLTPKYFYAYQGIFIGMFLAAILFSLYWWIPTVLMGAYLGHLMDERASKKGQQLRTPWLDLM